MAPAEIRATLAEGSERNNLGTSTSKTGSAPVFPWLPQKSVPRWRRAANGTTLVPAPARLAQRLFSHGSRRNPCHVGGGQRTEQPWYQHQQDWLSACFPMAPAEIRATLAEGSERNNLG